AIDIAACRPLPDFERDVETLIEDLKATPRAPGVDEILYPGEPEARAEQAALRDGIDLPEEVAETLRRGARELGAPLPF
ncbi:MAG: Ldh family oxidoreductase, partial [Pseudomonadota bacterium]